MAIKKLQNNFTTPEQSERLLAIGVPVDSADMYYKHTMLTPYILNDGVLFSVYSKVEDITPCWSVGRLIEIFELCTSSKFERIKTKCSVLEDILWQIEIYVTETSKGFSIDFSKLEELC